ncbi:MAG: rRNA maturation RNase YbeY [Actinobacteria bacterium]|nr:rRNA maturation RNase YbeY [Actinomycetota bacterium]
MTIEITNRSGQLVPSDKCLSLLTYAYGKLELHPDCDLNLTFIDDKEMEELHIKWMDLPGSTDVLSFPMDMPENGDDPVTLGDIVISPRFAEDQAAKAGHSINHEIFILATHGLLHILGYDHEDIEDESVMFALQESIVSEWEEIE